MTLPSAIIAIGAPIPYAERMAELAPWAYWRLNEPAGAALVYNVGSAAGGDGTVLAATLGVPGLLTGDSNRAADFAGAADPITASLPAIPGAGLARSMAAWITVSDWTAYHGILSAGNSHAFLKQATLGRFSFTFRTTGGVGTSLTAPNDTVPMDSARHFVVGTHDGTTARLYVDGAEVASLATVSIALPAFTTWRIGATTSSTERFIGVIDEPAVFDRALTAAEIADLYAIGVSGASASVECDVLHAVIRHGRDDPSTQPEADAATLELVGVLPAAAVIGAHVAVRAVHPITVDEYERFSGRITDIRIGWDSLDVPTATIIAVGELADMGRRMIGDAPYPAELDGTRVNRAIAAAGVATDPIRSDPGYLGVLARDVDAQPALTVAADAAFDGGGFVWQATDGAVLYADAWHRRAAQLALELVACDLPLELTWYQSLEGLANDVAVRYGLPEAEVTASDGDSIATYGTHAASLTTRIAAESDAQERANLIIARQSDPVWILGALGFELQSPGVGHELTTALLALEMHALINVSGMPAGSPMAGAFVFVEGWTETIDPGAWRLELLVSDYCRTAPAPQWDDADPAWLWDSIDPAMTWNGISCLPPFVSGYPGRWQDVPSSQRWDTVPSGTTWDTWAIPTA